MCYILPIPSHHDIARALLAHKEASGESHRSVAARAGGPTRSLTAILAGHAPSRTFSSGSSAASFSITRARSRNS